MLSQVEGSHQFLGGQWRLLLHIASFVHAVFHRVEALLMLQSQAFLIEPIQPLHTA